MKQMDNRVEFRGMFLLGIPQQVYGEGGSAHMRGEENSEGKEREQEWIERVCERGKK